MPNSIFEELRAKLPAMKAEYAKLGQLIALIEGEEPPPPPGGSPDGTNAEGPPPSTGRIGRDEFVGMSTAKAIIAFLTAKGKGNPQGPKAMAQALVEGGQIADYDKAYANVQSSLKRLNKSGKIRQVRRGEWGLSSWYGGAPPKPNGARPKEAEESPSEAETAA